MGEPPGGPPDSTPPHIVVARPESGAVVPNFSGDAVLDFDEVIDEMAGAASGAAGGAGAVTGIGRQVVLSPVSGEVRASWHRKSIRVRPAEGWKANRVYHLELLPGIVDLRHNVLKRGQTIVFSTGPAIPQGALTGTALQWVEQRALAKAVIRAAPLPDTVPYIAIADSSGGFAFGAIPRGTYRVAAIQDQNGNRRLDPREAFDTATVTVDTSGTVLLWAFAHDTAAPRLRQVDPIDSLAFRMGFSEPLDPAHPPDTAAVRLFALPDTTPVALAGVWTSAQFDSLQARARAAADSLRRATDTTHHAERPGTPLKQRVDTAGTRPDTGRVRRLLRQRPVPTDRFVARAAKPLTPGARYLVRARGVRSLTGRLGEGQQVFEAPPRPAARDSAAAKPAPAKPAPAKPAPTPR